jgi:tetratricopeptide (TPR) repeat protein
MSLLRRLFETDVASHLARAEKYERMGRLGMARLELDRALESVGIAHSAQRAQINAFLDRLAQQEQEDAEACAREALKQGDSKKARYYLNLALSKLQEDSPAYQDLRTQLESIPPDLEATGRDDELETLLTEEPGIDFVERQRALEFWKSGFPPYKEDYYFKKALSSETVRAQAEEVERSPDDPDTCFNFGITLAQLGLIDKAAEQIRHVVSLKPEDRDAHYFLANLLADQGRDDEAVREFEKTISIDPEFVEAYFYLGEHYENLEDRERAEMCFEHILRDKSDHELAEEARTKLEALRSQDESSSTHKNLRSRSSS